MTINVDVIGQKLKIVSNTKNLVSGSQNFIRFFFNLDSDWDGLTVFAQFQQNGNSYNQTLDGEKSAYLPAEITDGKVNLLLYGTGGTVIATVNYLTFTVDKSIIVENAHSTQISTPIYTQLINRIAALTASPAGSGGDVGTELRDIRTAWDGTTFESASDSVHYQAQSAFNGGQTFINNSKFNSTDYFSGDFNNVPNNKMYPIEVSFDSDESMNQAHAPVRNVRGTLLTFGRKPSTQSVLHYNLDNQILIQQNGDIYWRCVSNVDSNNSSITWAGWATPQQYRPGVNSNHAIYDNKLSHYKCDGVFIATKVRTENNATIVCWTDLPNDTAAGFAIINLRYSNYILQKAVDIDSGAIFNRIINKNSNDDDGIGDGKAVYRDWICENPDIFQNKLKVLAIGDSICYGGRNDCKGFVGDLGLNIINKSIVGIRLSERNNSSEPSVRDVDSGYYRPSIGRLFDILTGVEIIPSASAFPENLSFNARLITNFGDVSLPNNYYPDIIIANGGTNDYIFNATLGVVPYAPAADASSINRCTVIGGLEYLLYRMVKRYPKAQRFFLIQHKVYDGTHYWVTHANDAGYTQQQLHDAIVACCEVYNVKVIDIYKDSFINSMLPEYRSSAPYASNHALTDTEYIDSDGVHPMALGYKKGYVPLVKEAIKGTMP